MKISVLVLLSCLLSVKGMVNVGFKIALSFPIDYNFLQKIVKELSIHVK